MRVYASRDSVAYGDDLDAPHAASFSVSDGTPLEQVISDIVESGYLPRIMGGLATWSVVSGMLLGIVAQQWQRPRMVVASARPEGLDIEDGVLRLYFNYHTQIDPEIVRKVLWGFRLTAV
jgi:hypothetical protein